MIAQIRKNIGLLVTIIIFSFFLFFLLSQKSSNPFILDRYSLSYFVLLVLVIIGIIYTIILKFVFGKKFKNILMFIGLLLFALVITLELFGQVYASFFPSYQSLSLQPDPILGWKFVPNMKFINTDHYWYAREFSAEVKINSQGFRDKERKHAKEKNIFRIAILGDSMVAARQVSFDKTAAQLLETKLNNELGEVTGKKFEVLNFGVGAYGLGQYYLTWKNYASQFKPDITFAYIFEYTYMRTINLTRCSNEFKLFGNTCFSIRPAFTTTTKFPHFVNPDISKKLDNLYLKKKFHDYFSRLSNEGLFHIQPKDYKNFVQAQEKLLKIKFEGKRVIQKKRKFFVASLLNEIQFKLNSIQRKFDSNWKLKLDKETKDKFSGKTKSFPAWLPINHVNLRLLGELSKIIKEKGSNLVVTDTFKYHSKSSSYIDNSSEFLYQSSKYYDFSYIPLHKDLNESAQRGISVSWKYDGHLNKIGNKIFADAMYHHIANNVFTNISTASKKN